jgi:hypothetical protein
MMTPAPSRATLSSDNRHGPHHTRMRDTRGSMRLSGVQVTKPRRTVNAANRPRLGVSIAVVAIVGGISLYSTAVILTIELGLGPRDQVTPEINAGDTNLHTASPANITSSTLGVNHTSASVASASTASTASTASSNITIDLNPSPPTATRSRRPVAPLRACSAPLGPPRDAGTGNPPFMTVSGSRNEPLISIR